MGRALGSRLSGRGFDSLTITSQSSWSHPQDPKQYPLPVGGPDGPPARRTGRGGGGATPVSRWARRTASGPRTAAHGGALQGGPRTGPEPRGGRPAAPRPAGTGGRARSLPPSPSQPDGRAEGRRVGSSAGPPAAKVPADRPPRRRCGGPTGPAHRGSSVVRVRREAPQEAHEVEHLAAPAPGRARGGIEHRPPCPATHRASRRQKGGSR